ncbi:hypothetical protein GQ53DRAFT_202197 [Thozetella sp. PMI_491]|nr:hypothetical protein GQ53DRAFT_202197 [Thozetella sp. PMI_491]
MARDAWPQAEANKPIPCSELMVSLGMASVPWKAERACMQNAITLSRSVPFSPQPSPSGRTSVLSQAQDQAFLAKRPETCLSPAPQKNWSTSHQKTGGRNEMTTRLVARPTRWVSSLSTIPGPTEKKKRRSNIAHPGRGPRFAQPAQPPSSRVNCQGGTRRQR